MANKKEWRISATALIFGLILSCFCLQSCSFFKKAKMDHISGIVRDDNGQPLKDVVVDLNGEEVTTDQNGIFGLEITDQTDSRYVLKFSHKGYFSVTRSADMTSVGQVEVTLQPVKKEGVSNATNFNAKKGGQVKVGNMTVNIPANGLVTEDGSTYKGKVDFKMLYLNPKKEDFAASMPGGDLAAQDSTGEQLALVSYGMVDVVMTDEAGKKLQLKKGTKSELTFPIPDGMAEKAPAEMPLWSFNETTGVWEESGKATRQGDKYVGEVGHFSWVNLDDPKQFVVLKGTVKDKDGNPLPGIRLSVEQVTCFTNSEGKYSVRIPGETDVTISVKSVDYLNYTPEVSVKVEGQPGGSKYTQDIELPTMPIVKGSILNTGSKACPFSLFCQYEKDGKKLSTGLTLCKTNGEFMLRLPAEAKNATLHICSPDGKDQSQQINFEGKDLDLGTLNACYIELKEREQPALTIDGKETEIEIDDCDAIGFNGEKGNAHIVAGDLTIDLEKYSEKKETYDASIELEELGYHSTSAQVTKKKVGNRIQLKITSVGYISKDGERKDTKFDAVIYVPMLYCGKCSNADNLCWPTDLPKPRTPMVYATENYIFGMPEAVLVYQDMAESDLDMLEKLTHSKKPFQLVLSYQKCSEEEQEKIANKLEELGYKESGSNEYEKGDKAVDIIAIEHQLENSLEPQTAQYSIDIKIGLGSWFKALVKKYLGISL